MLTLLSRGHEDISGHALGGSTISDDTSKVVSAHVPLIGVFDEFWDVSHVASVGDQHHRRWRHIRCETLQEFEPVHLEEQRYCRGQQNGEFAYFN